MSNETTEIIYTAIKGTVTMALDTSTVCTYVYDNSKCIGAEQSTDQRDRSITLHKRWIPQ